MRESFEVSKYMHGGHRWISFTDLKKITHTIPVSSIRLQNRFIRDSKDIDKEPDEMHCFVKYDGEEYQVGYEVWMEINDFLMGN